MAVLSYSDIVITGVAGDGIVDADEASSSFQITGSGNSVLGNVLDLVLGSTIDVTVTWFDGTDTVSQVFQAEITGITIESLLPSILGSFTWSINVENFSESFPDLVFGQDSVSVTFPGDEESNTANFTFACFHRGTRVLTRHGYCPVEELTAGDELCTLKGGWQPLRWIGRQRITTPFGRVKGVPVCITAGAFGPALPQRDVLVSAGHAIFFRNHLIPAASLVNGVTVFYDTEIRDIEYFHLLLDRHEVIFSEGLATESYVPCENIDWFDNTSTCPQALLNAIRAGTAQCLKECYSRRVNGPVVETARALLTRFAPVAVTNRAVG